MIKCGGSEEGPDRPEAGPGPEGVLKHKREQGHSRDKKVPLLGQGTGNGHSLYKADCVSGSRC